MDENEVFKTVITILKPFVKNQEAFANVGLETFIQKDLKVNSARMVDIVLEVEERFDIQVKDEDADKVRTVGDAVRIVLAQKAKA
jgi:acyl carrier protein